MGDCNILPMVIIAILVIIALYYLSKNPVVSQSAPNDQIAETVTVDADGNVQGQEGFYPYRYGYGYGYPRVYGQIPWQRYYGGYNYPYGYQ